MASASLISLRLGFSSTPSPLGQSVLLERLKHNLLQPQAVVLMVETVGGRRHGCGRAVHHAMPTPNCNTSNRWVFDPFDPPTSGSASACASSYPWDRRAMYPCSSPAPHEPPS